MMMITPSRFTGHEQ